MVETGSLKREMSLKCVGTAPPAGLRCAAWLYALLFVVGFAAPVAADWKWSAERGWHDANKSILNTPLGLMTEANKAFAAQRYSESALGFRLLVDSHPESELVTAAFMKVMESQYLGRRYTECLATIDEILLRKPGADVLSQLIKRKYEIGTAFITGTRRRFFGISMSAENYGVEILDSLVERFPFQPYSDDSLYHIAAYYLGRREYLEAEVVYERLIRDYPQSDWAGLAEYQIGASALSRLKGSEYDFGSVDKAERRLRRYLRLYPSGGNAQAAKEGLARVSELRAEKLFGIAQFYQREGKTNAVRTYLQRLTRDHPETRVAAKALQLLRKIAEDQSPDPQKGKGDDGGS